MIHAQSFINLAVTIIVNIVAEFRCVGMDSGIVVMVSVVAIKGGGIAVTIRIAVHAINKTVAVVVYSIITYFMRIGIDVCAARHRVVITIQILAAEAVIVPVRAGIAGIANAVSVGILLVGIGDEGAVVFGVGKAVRVIVVQDKTQIVVAARRYG